MGTSGVDYYNWTSPEGVTISCYDVIEDFVMDLPDVCFGSEIAYFYIGNILKYLFRLGVKPGADNKSDFAKVMDYYERLLDTLESDEIQRQICGPSCKVAKSRFLTHYSCDKRASGRKTIAKMYYCSIVQWKEFLDELKVDLGL